MSTVSISGVHQGRWGFYPVDYATFLQLKELNKLYFENLRRSAASERWSRKLPCNRVIRSYSRNAAGQRTGVLSTRPAPEPRYNYQLLQLSWIPGAYRLARYPAGSPESVRLLVVSVEKIGEALQLARAA